MMRLATNPTHSLFYSFKRMIFSLTYLYCATNLSNICVDE